MTADSLPRDLSTRLPAPAERTLIVLTGSRQVGKTTLARQHYPTLRYLSMDVAEDRDVIRALPTRMWAATIGEAILDEAQKEPAIFDKIKHAFDERAIGFSVLLGSAQIGLMRQISESLAGRTLVFELWPLLVAELAGAPGLLPRLRSQDAPLRELLDAEPELQPSDDELPRLQAFEHLATWGGMPALLRLAPERRGDWLRSYAQTYLERDLHDLARLDDLQPFRTFQRLSALRAAQRLSFAELGRDASVSAKTARNYLEYLRISYQAFLLQPYFENLTSAAVKTPKLYWVDIGLLRHVSGQQGPLTGALFENLVVAEVVKDLRTSGSVTTAWYYATRSGLEVDLLLQTGDRFVGIEIKNRERTAHADGRALRALAKALGPRWRGGLVVHRGRGLRSIDDAHDIWAMPVHRLL